MKHFEIDTNALKLIEVGIFCFMGKSGLKLVEVGRCWLKWPVGRNCLKCKKVKIILKENDKS